MLNKGERFEYLRLFRFWCKFGLLPVQVNLSTWEIRPRAKRLTIWMCLLWHFLFALHSLYKAVALVYWLKVGIPLHQAVIHAVLASSFVLLVYCYYVMFIKYRRLFGVYLSMTLAGNENCNGAAVDSPNVRSWSRRLKECTLQDIFAMTYSYTLPQAYLAIMFTFIFNPSMKYLLYAALPKEYQTWITFGILLIEEMRVSIVACSIAVPVFTVQVLSFELVRNKLQLLMYSLQRGARLRTSAYIFKTLRHIQLYVGMTNLINCTIIFLMKVLIMGLAIGTGYAAIAHFSDYPIFGVIYYLCFFQVTVIHVFCYDKAFKIPALFHEVTQRAMLTTRYVENTEASKMFKRQMRSFPRVGIKVGEFRLMERDSTMSFIDFVLNNIVSLLVAYG